MNEVRYTKIIEHRKEVRAALVELTGEDAARDVESRVGKEAHERLAGFSYELGRRAALAEQKPASPKTKPKATPEASQEPKPSQEQSEPKSQARGRQRALQGVRRQPRILQEEQKRKSRLV